MRAELRCVAGELFRLYGGMTQEERSETFRRYTVCVGGILLCTDVAARGLDLPALMWTLQFDPPTSTKDYVHRVGRTARMGEVGNALLFLDSNELEYLDVLKAQTAIEMTQLSYQRLMQPLALSAAEGGGRLPRKELLKRGIMQAASALNGLVNNTQELHDLGVKAWQSTARAYATHSRDTKHIFNMGKLHVGHLVTSFGLREKPSELVCVRVRVRVC